METIYNRMKGPSLFKHGSLNRFGIITLINIYRMCIYKISFPDMKYWCIKLACSESGKKFHPNLIFESEAETRPKVLHFELYSKRLDWDGALVRLKHSSLLS